MVLLLKIGYEVKVLVFLVPIVSGDYTRHLVVKWFTNYSGGLLGVVGWILGLPFSPKFPSLTGNIYDFISFFPKQDFFFKSEKYDSLKEFATPLS